MAEGEANAKSGEHGLDPRILDTVLEVSRRLDRPFQLDEMLERVVDAARDLLSADRGSVFLYDDERREFVSKISTGTGTLRFPVDRGILGAAATTRAVVNVPDCYADPRFNRESDRVTGYRTRCLLAVPLIGREDALVGVLQLLNKTGGVFDARDETVASVLASQCALALQRARLTEQLVQRERMNEELSIARQIQRSMLSSEFETVGREGNCEVFATLEAAREVGGDFYDVFFVGAGRLCVCVGDVCGKGVPAGLFMAITKTMLAYGAEGARSTGAVVTDVNERISRRNPESMFVTLFVGILDTKSGELTYTNAGHNPPFLKRRDGSMERLDARHGPVVGAMPESRYGEERVELRADDLLFLYTDGVTEAMSADGEPFTEARLVEWLAASEPRTPEVLVTAAVERVHEFERGAEQADDITVLALRFGSRGP